jgi:hypothetical protein
MSRPAVPFDQGVSSLKPSGRAGELIRVKGVDVQSKINRLFAVWGIGERTRSWCVETSAASISGAASVSDWQCQAVIFCPRRQHLSLPQ